MLDKKFSIICPLYKDGYETIDHFVLCLKEQDYTNWELIFVHNSPDDKAKKYVNSKKMPEVKFTQIDAGYYPDLKRGNHCNAFNEGARIATGDYLLFLDPDIYLLPGVLREYKDAFDAHPEVDFVYGDYDFEGGAGRITGRPYSEYEMRCANYISGAFPIRNSAFRGWDTTVQSLQDWDMWLSTIDAGAKGMYIGRPCFTTVAPKPDGISSDSAANWKERYNYVREKHGFPPSKMVVTSLGAPLHATKVAEILKADSRVIANLPCFKPHDYETMYLLGFYPLAWHQHMRLFYELGDVKAKLATKKRIIHWIGTDIYQMQHKLSWIAWQNIKTFLNDPEFEFIHLAEAEFTRDELAELGIKADVVPLPIKTDLSISPLPEKFTVGVYINPTQDMYHEEFMEEIAKAMPDVDFKFFGNEHRKETIGNIEWVGWVDMKQFLPTISALVRLTVHDGLPIGPIEAMIAGRNVLTSVPMKHALHTEYKLGEPDKADVVKKIRQLRRMPVNTEASAYWKEETSPTKFIERINQYVS